MIALCYHLFMAQLLIRNLDEKIVVRLKEKAAASEMSLEQFLRDLLTREVTEQTSDYLHRLRDLRESIPPFDYDPVELIERDRESRDADFVRLFGSDPT